MKNLLILCMILLSGIQLSKAQQTPAPKQSEVISIQNATIHQGNGQVLENATLVFENGKITAVGTDVSPQGTIIDAGGKHVYPGFILANSTLGLGEIDAVRATRDFDELGTFLPHVRSLIAYNAESKVIESLRPNGVLVAQVAPRGGRISGTSSIVQLDAWNWEDAAIKVDDAIHMNWPQSFKRSYRGFGRIIISEASKEYTKEVAELKEFLLQAKAYDQGSAKNKHIPFAASKGLFDGSQKLYIHASKSKEIVDAINLTKELGISNVILVGGEEAHEHIDLLVENNISVLVKRVHSLPDADDDDYDISFKRASLLHKGGVLVALENSGGMERMNGRNLPFYAGTTTAHGLSNEEALQLISANPAKILGIEASYGTLEVGKSATLFISEGDALDMRTNLLTEAFIDGRKISLETHQTELWKRYMGKYSPSE